MKIGKYIIRRSSKIRKDLINKLDYEKTDEWRRVLQIYECRIFGICFYRTENDYRLQIVNFKITYKNNLLRLSYTDNNKYD